MKLVGPAIKLIGAIIVVALLVFAFNVFFESPAKTPPAPTKKSDAQLPGATPPVVSCSSPDQSICTTQLQFMKFVSEADFSDILNYQKVDHVTCNTSSSPADVCKGISGNLSIDAFAVIENGTTDYMTRNGYITYFMNYSKNYGPFQFTGDQAENGGITVQFAGNGSGKQLDLSFKKSGSTWSFTNPEINL
jgi:hypothetical protein